MGLTVIPQHSRTNWQSSYYEKWLTSHFGALWSLCPGSGHGPVRIIQRKDFLALFALHRGIMNLSLDQGQKASVLRSEEHTSELQSLMRISYAVFCLKKQKSHICTSITQSSFVR